MLASLVRGSVFAESMWSGPDRKWRFLEFTLLLSLIPDAYPATKFKSPEPKEDNESYKDINQSRCTFLECNGFVLPTMSLLWYSLLILIDVATGV